MGQAKITSPSFDLSKPLTKVYRKVKEPYNTSLALMVMRKLPILETENKN